MTVDWEDEDTEVIDMPVVSRPPSNSDAVPQHVSDVVSQHVNDAVPRHVVPEVTRPIGSPRMTVRLRMDSWNCVCGSAS